jgi:hypothetical protein
MGASASPSTSTTFDIAAATPGSAEYLVTKLTARGNKCPHFPKITSGHKSGVPHRLGFFCTTAQGIACLETNRICMNCYDAAVPNGFNTWLAAEEPSLDVLNANADIYLPAYEASLENVSKSGEGVRSTHPKRQGSLSTSCKLDFEATKAFQWLVAEAKPFYIDHLHLTKPWNARSQNLMVESRTAAQNSGTVYMKPLFEVEVVEVVETVEAEEILPVATGAVPITDAQDHETALTADTTTPRPKPKRKSVRNETTGVEKECQSISTERAPTNEVEVDNPASASEVKREGTRLRQITRKAVSVKKASEAVKSRKKTPPTGPQLESSPNQVRTRSSGLGDVEAAATGYDNVQSPPNKKTSAKKIEAIEKDSKALEEAKKSNRKSVVKAKLTDEKTNKPPKAPHEASSGASKTRKASNNVSQTTKVEVNVNGGEQQPKLHPRLPRRTQTDPQRGVKTAEENSRPTLPKRPCAPPTSTSGSSQQGIPDAVPTHPTTMATAITSPPPPLPKRSSTLTALDKGLSTLSAHSIQAKEMLSASSNPKYQNLASAAGALASAAKFAQGLSQNIPDRMRGASNMTLNSNYDPRNIMTNSASLKNSWKGPKVLLNLVQKQTMSAPVPREMVIPQGKVPKPHVPSPFETERASKSVSWKSTCFTYTFALSSLASPSTSSAFSGKGSSWCPSSCKSRYAPASPRY